MLCENCREDESLHTVLVIENRQANRPEVVAVTEVKLCPTAFFKEYKRG